jgi:photoactive yellow protein
MQASASPTFSTGPALDTITAAQIEAMGAAALDALPFGIIGLDHGGMVVLYTMAEARYAGLPRETVLGRHFFTAVAPCMNNALVAARLEAEGDLDVVIDYVLTFRMRPARVKVRLIKNRALPRRYVLIQR